MTGIVERRSRRQYLHDAAAEHHGDPRRDVPDHVEVVADEDHAEWSRLRRSAKQVEDLRLDRDVERADRLVGDQDVGARASARAMQIRCRWPPEKSDG
jgi:hypothetical protein